MYEDYISLNLFPLDYLSQYEFVHFVISLSGVKYQLANFAASIQSNLCKNRKIRECTSEKMTSGKTEIKVVEESEIMEVVLGEAVAPLKMSGQVTRDSSVAKGLFTKKRNEISNIFEELTERSEVEKKVSELISSFEGLVRAHVLYHDTLTEKLDIEESNDYMRFEDLKFKELAHSLDKCKAKLLGNSENLPVNLQSLVTPYDSASQAGKSKRSFSVGSSLSSTEAKLSAKTAGLLAKASTLGKLNEIEQKQLQLKQVK